MKGSIRISLATALVAAMLASLSACNMHVQKDENGHEKKVDISTPLGGLKVRTDHVDAKDTGLPVYAGALLKQKSNNDENKANVDIDTPFFGLKVVALTYTSSDSADKVLSYYRDQIKSSYGNVVECRGDTKGDNVKGTDDLDKPVSCSDKISVNGDKHGKGAMVINDDPKTIELKTGTKGNQRVVAVKPTEGGSEFSLVYVRMRGGKEDSI